MRIGQDFQPVAFELFGLQLIEPNALIGDTLIALISFYLAYRTYKISTNSTFFSRWKQFYLVFGISFIGGGLGHSFFNMWGVQGKYFGWITALIAVYIIEQAMLSIYPNKKHIKRFQFISLLKLILSEIALIAIFCFADLENNPQKGLLVPSISTAIGFIICLGMLGRVYQKNLSASFKFFWISVLIMIPTAIIQGMKISFHPLFDRNDMSHLLLIVSLILYWKGISGYARHLKK